jgi:hypothetical protein
MLFLAAYRTGKSKSIYAIKKYLIIDFDSDRIPGQTLLFLNRSGSDEGCLGDVHLMSRGVFNPPMEPFTNKLTFLPCMQLIIFRLFSFITNCMNRP